jgi:GNAT superfamily N-acetyltransferase
MSVEFRRERIDDWLKDAVYILQKQLDEASEIEDDIVNLDWDLYTALEQLDRLHIITGRNEKRELVAHYVGVTSPHPHHKHVLTSYHDMIWVRPDYRGITVLRLYKFIDNYFEKLGVQRSYNTIRAKNAKLGRLIERLGYVKDEEIYLKVR